MGLYLKSSPKPKSRQIFVQEMSITQEAEETRTDTEMKMRSYSPREKICNEFINSSTLHGLQNVFTARSKVQRMFWLFALLSAVVYVVFLIVTAVQKYFKYEVDTKTTLIYQTYSIFPATTICNFNMFSGIKIANSSYTELLNPSSLISEYKDINITSEEMENIYDEIGSHLHILECYFKNVKCTLANFTVTFTSMGRCYTFNSGQEGYPLMKVRSPGKDYGLHLLIDVYQDDYMKNIGSAGLKVLLHDQDMPPRVNNLGFAVSPGTHVFASVKKTELKNLPSPYETNCRNLDIPGYKTYSKPACELACYAKYIIQECGCRTLEMKIEGYQRVCNFTETEVCVSEARTIFNVEISSTCHCPEACQAVVYEPSLSYARFPSFYKIDDLSEPWIQQYSQMANDSDSLLDIISENVLQMNIFYKDLNFELIEQVPQMSKSQLFGEIGGIIGLFAGASVLTMYEMANFVVDLLCALKRKRSTSSKVI